MSLAKASAFEKSDHKNKAHSLIITTKQARFFRKGSPQLQKPEAVAQFKCDSGFHKSAVKMIFAVR